MVKSIWFLHLVVFFFFFFSHTNSLSSPKQQPQPQPQPLPLLSLRTKPANQAASSCYYRVRITTSCSSVRYTRDQISFSFGDAYGNQVYVPKLDSPATHAFEACSADTFDIYGPCTYDVCYVYLYRRGNDGLNVGSVQISGQYIRTVTYNYNSWVPSNVWWGYNYCHGSFASPVM